MAVDMDHESQSVHLHTNLDALPFVDSQDSVYFRGALRDNLHRFLAHTSPTVEPVDTAVDEKDGKRRGPAVFRLADLWSYYDEPYGHEIPIDLDDGHGSYAFFVPYLSAMRIFARPHAQSAQGTAHSGHASGTGLLHSPPAHSLRPRILLEFAEYKRPHERINMTAQIRELAHHFEGLLTATTADIDCERSWYAVSWYPILCDPYTNAAVRGCFLTYHRFAVAGECPLSPHNAAAADSTRRASLTTDDRDRGFSPSSASSSSSEVDVGSSSDDEAMSSTHDNLAELVDAMCSTVHCRRQPSQLSQQHLIYRDGLPDREVYISLVGVIPFKVKLSTWCTRRAYVENNGCGTTLEHMRAHVDNLVRTSAVSHPDYEHMTMTRKPR